MESVRDMCRGESIRDVTTAFASPLTSGDARRGCILDNVLAHRTVSSTSALSSSSSSAPSSIPREVVVVRLVVRGAVEGDGEAFVEDDPTPS